MSVRMNFKLQVTTAPANRAFAQPHTGGWTEGFWEKNADTIDVRVIRALARKRAAMLPKQAAIVGWGLQVYTITGNKLIPRGSAVQKELFTGNAIFDTDLPQVALEMSAGSTGVNNKSRFTLRCIPDDMMKFGEYQPSDDFDILVKAFGAELVRASWEFLGRDLAQPRAKVLSIVAGLLTTDGVIGAAVGDYVILNRVKDTAGKPVKGSFRVTAQAGLTYTLAFPAGVNPTVGASGSARKDVIDLFTFSSVNASRAVIKKIGRPFESYRGKQSKKVA